MYQNCDLIVGCSSQILKNTGLQLNLFFRKQFPSTIVLTCKLVFVRTYDSELSINNSIF